MPMHPETARETLSSIDPTFLLMGPDVVQHDDQSRESPDRYLPIFRGDYVAGRNGNAHVNTPGRVIGFIGHGEPFPPGAAVVELRGPGEAAVREKGRVAAHKGRYGFSCEVDLGRIVVMQRSELRLLCEPHNSLMGGAHDPDAPAYFNVALGAPFMLTASRGNDVLTGDNADAATQATLTDVRMGKLDSCSWSVVVMGGPLARSSAHAIAFRHRDGYTETAGKDAADLIHTLKWSTPR